MALCLILFFFSFPMSDDTFSSVFRTNTRIEDFFDDTDFVTKPRKAENFIRLGQTRQNRPLIMSHINKRMACFADDYATFLDTICGLLQIPIDNIEHFVCINLTEQITIF